MSDAVLGSRPFRPEERPVLPGSPYSPLHSPARRIGYAAIGLLLAMLVNFGNGLVTANVPVLAGARDDYLISTALLTGIYIAFNASGNLILVKARIQFGIPQITLPLLVGYALAAALLFFTSSYAAAILLAAVSGICAACMTTLAVYYTMQSLPAKVRPVGIVIAIGAVQFGSPLARLVPVDLISLGGLQAFALLQFAVPVLAAGALLGHPLPPSERSRSFEPLDGLTIPLLITANLLLCAVLSEGRLLWWGDTPWLGWALAACIPLYAAGLAIEGSRANPLLHLRWYGEGLIIRFALVAVVVRLALSEQSYGAVGLLSFAGLDNDQFHMLFACIFGAQLLGILLAAATTRPTSTPYQVMAAAVLIGIGALLDTGSTNLTRPDNLIFSQSLIAFGTTLFIGPTLIFGFLQMLKKGADHLVSLVVLFSVTQNIGGLAGSALLGSYQIVQAKYHGAVLAEGLAAGDPLVTARIQQGAQALSGVITDPVQRTVQGGALLGRALSREAAVLGFNDSFRLVAFVAFAAALFLAVAIAWTKIQQRLSSPKGVAP